MAAIFGVILVLTFALFSAIGSDQERIMLVIILVETSTFWYSSVRVALQGLKQPSKQEIEAQKEIQLLRDELGRVQKVSHKYSSRLWSLGPKLDRAEAQVKEYKAAIEQPDCPVDASGFQPAIPALSPVPPPSTATPGHKTMPRPATNRPSQGGGGRECVRWTIRMNNTMSDGPFPR